MKDMLDMWIRMVELSYNRAFKGFLDMRKVGKDSDYRLF